MLALWLASAVLVEGDAACPSPAAVQQRLAPLLPEVAGPHPDRARVDLSAAGAVTVTLYGPDGTLIGTRTLPAEGSCDERARAAAVILGTWESDVHPVFERPARPTSASAGGPRAAQPAPSGSLSAPARSAAAPAAVRTTPASATKVSAPWELGAGLLGGLTGGALAPGAQVVAGLFPVRAWRVRLALLGDGERSLSVGSGRGRWSRWSAAVGPQVHVGGALWSVDAHASALVGWFSVQGEGFPVAYRGSGVDVGALAGVRLVGPGGKALRAWLSLEAARWLGRREVTELVAGEHVDVPRWSAFLSAGVSFFFRPSAPSAPGPQL